MGIVIKLDKEHAAALRSYAEHYYGVQDALEGPGPFFPAGGVPPTPSVPLALREVRAMVVQPFHDDMDFEVATATAREWVRILEDGEIHYSMEREDKLDQVLSVLRAALENEVLD